MIFLLLQILQGSIAEESIIEGRRINQVMFQLYGRVTMEQRGN